MSTSSPFDPAAFRSIERMLKQFSEPPGFVLKTADVSRLVRSISQGPALSIDTTALARISDIARQNPAVFTNIASLAKVANNAQQYERLVDNHSAITGQITKSYEKLVRTASVISRFAETISLSPALVGLGPFSADIGLLVSSNPAFDAALPDDDVEPTREQLRTALLAAANWFAAQAATVMAVEARLRGHVKSFNEAVEEYRKLVVTLVFMAGVLLALWECL